MKTIEAFRINQAVLEQSLRNAGTTEETNVAIQMAFERTAATLAQNETDEVTRQREQAVLSLAKQSGLFLRAVRADGRLVLKDLPEKHDGPGLNIPQYIIYAGYALMGCLAASELINGKWMFALLSVIAVLLMILGREEMKPDDSGSRWMAEGQIRIDPESVMRTMEEMCQAIDIAVSDLALIDREQSVRSMGGQEDALLDFMSALLEARESGREDLVVESVEEAEQTLHRLGIQVVRYTPENAALFDLLPTIGDSRTVRPALVSDEHVVRRGVAAVRMQEVGK